MDAVTYPQNSVVDFVNNKLIAMRLPSDSKPYADQYGVKWTPRLFLLDSTGAPHHDTVGFLPPEEFIAAMELGEAKIDFDLDCLEDCSDHLNNVIGGPKTAAVPEALFMMGVVAYKKSGKATPLKAAYEKLLAEFPDSEWTIRALPYRLL